MSDPGSPPDDSDRLKPCPFCGSDAVIGEDDSDQGYYVECIGCGASSCKQYACGDDPLPLLHEKWNRRAPTVTPEPR